MHALIIEDEYLIVMAIEDVLRDCGFDSFDFAWSADEAIAAANRRCPDLITADVQLTPGSGIAAVEAICSNHLIPVIFITSNTAKVRKRLPQQLMLDKPFTEAALTSAVAVALGKS